MIRNTYFGRARFLLSRNSMGSINHTSSEPSRNLRYERTRFHPIVPARACWISGTNAPGPATCPAYRQQSPKTSSSNFSSRFWPGGPIRKTCYSADYSFIQMIYKFVPRGFTLIVNDRITTAFWKCFKTTILYFAFSIVNVYCFHPKILWYQRFQLVATPRCTIGKAKTKTGNFAKRQRPISKVVIRPANLSHPASIRNDELPVMRTRTLCLPTRFLTCGAHASRFELHQKKDKQVYPY